MQKEFEKRLLTKRKENLSRWYTQVVSLAKLADYGPVRGTMVIRPYGFAIWENIQKALDSMIKEAGVENAYFPLFIPYSILKKEKEHIEGFSPELALVTIGGGEKLKEPLVVRPTSEMVMYEMYARWIKSWRDLPMKINQWNNVVRWEKRTYLFLRTLEFLWQEGHCAHETHEESKEMVFKALEFYRRIYEEYFAIPVIVGEKSQSEKFAGAHSTYSLEALMPDGKAIQGATSHDLGQNFSKALGIKFQDRNGNLKFVWQNSWGLSTRCLGPLIMIHGDDNGLVLPPRIAPVKVVIIPILGKKDEEILKYCQKIKAKIEEKSSIYPGRVEIFADSEKSFGWRINEVELKGIPIRIEIGTRELQEGTVSLVGRVNQIRQIARFKEVDEKVETLLGQIQNEIHERAKGFLVENTHDAKNFQEFKKIMKEKRGFIRAFWCENPSCEAEIKRQTKATTRVKPFEFAKRQSNCVFCGRDASNLWIFAQAY